MSKHRRTLMSYVPMGVQLNGGWMFVGVISALTGMGFATGIAESNSVTSVLNPVGLQVWGGVLMLAGILLCVGVAMGRLALEKLSLHFLSVCLVMYGGWILQAVPLGKTGITTALIVVLVVLAQIRCYVVRRLINMQPSKYYDIEEGE